MIFAEIANIAIFCGLLLFLYLLRAKGFTNSRQVLIGLGIGSLFGLALQCIYGGNSEAITHSLEWINIVGSGYVSLLKMVVMPLVLVSMVAAVVNLDKSASMGKISGLTILILLCTTAIAAIVGIGVASVFGLSVEGMVEGARESEKLADLPNSIGKIADLTIPQMIVSFIPTNPFADLAGARSTSIIAVVIFGVLLGIAARKVMQENSDLESPIQVFVNTVQSVVMRLVKLVISLTPFGVAALMTKITSTSTAADILGLFSFIGASYIAIVLMFAVHGALVLGAGVSPKFYFKQIWPVLTFAFTSRSSAATIPLNVEAQTKKLNIPPAIANLSATFGATIGQNGCAGIYPAMLSIMVAPSVGIDPMSFSFLVSLVAIITVSSFGIAGVGGGATFAALIVLPAMGMPVAIVALLISVEPLIDMARTALNVSGSMTTGILTNRFARSQ